MTQLNRIFISIIMTALCALCAYSSPVMSPDADVTVADDPIKVGSGRVKPLQGYYFFDGEDGEKHPYARACRCDSLSAAEVQKTKRKRNSTGRRSAM